MQFKIKENTYIYVIKSCQAKNQNIFVSIWFCFVSAFATNFCHFLVVVVVVVDDVVISVE